MSVAEFTQWAAEYRLDPWGESRGDLRAGTVCATIANVHAGKSSKVFTPGDFMPKFGEKAEPPKPATWQEMKAKLTMFGKMQNARIDANAKRKAARHGA